MYIIWIRGAINFYLSKTDTFRHSVYTLISVTLSAVTEWEVCIFKPQTYAVNKFVGLLYENIK
jgi:hypothetical protein